MTTGYFDATALKALAMPGSAGRQVAQWWSGLDAAFTSFVSEIEVPAEIGRQIDRVGWVWLLHTVNLVDWTAEMQLRAVDLAWLGAPLDCAMHVACGQEVGVDHFVTTDEDFAMWAELGGLASVLIA